jgi:hypothetical protein
MTSTDRIMRSFTVLAVIGVAAVAAARLDLNIQAVTVALALPHHDGRTEGVNTQTK